MQHEKVRFKLEEVLDHLQLHLKIHDSTLETVRSTYESVRGCHHVAAR